MITPSDKYLNLLYHVQNTNRQTKIIPNQSVKLTQEQFNAGEYYIEKNGKYVKATKYEEDAAYYYEPIYDIDLNRRTIEAPKFLSVRQDHNAEKIYFQVDRFFDSIDLSTMTCIVQYKNANPNVKESGYIFAVPYYDLTTKAKDNKMLFEWAIEGPATAFAGNVEFAIQFYKVSCQQIDSTNGSYQIVAEYQYQLNTIPAVSKVLHGIDFTNSDANFEINTDLLRPIWQEINLLKQTTDLYWIVLNDNTNVPSFEPDYPEETINKNEQITDLIT